MILEVRGRETKAFLKAECVGVKNEKGEQAFSLELIEALLVSTGQSITTDLMRFCAEDGIDVVITDHYGHPRGRVIGLEDTDHTRLRRRQICCGHKTRKRFIRWILGKKIDNQMKVLKLLAKNYAADIKADVEKLSVFRDGLAGISRGNIQGKAMTTEGGASRTYFDAINRIIPERFRLAERSRNPARDFFNCFLNFWYGHLCWSVGKIYIPKEIKKNVPLQSASVKTRIATIALYLLSGLWPVAKCVR